LRIFGKIIAIHLIVIHHAQIVKQSFTPTDGKLEDITLTRIETPGKIYRINRILPRIKSCCRCCDTVLSHVTQTIHSGSHFVKLSATWIPFFSVYTQHLKDNTEQIAQEVKETKGRDVQ
jgi:hypothetical protein